MNAPRVATPHDAHARKLPQPHKLWQPELEPAPEPAPELVPSLQPPSGSGSVARPARAAAAALEQAAAEQLRLLEAARRLVAEQAGVAEDERRGRLRAEEVARREKGRRQQGVRKAERRERRARRWAAEEARVETAAVETEARIDEGAAGILPRPDMCYTANPYGWSPYG